MHTKLSQTGSNQLQPLMLSSKCYADVSSRTQKSHNYYLTIITIHKQSLRQDNMWGVSCLGECLAWGLCLVLGGCLVRGDLWSWGVVPGPREVCLFQGGACSRGTCTQGGCLLQGCARFAEILSELTKTWSSGATECGVWIGNCNVKVWKSTEHKLHNIWRSVKFQQNEHTPGVPAPEVGTCSWGCACSWGCVPAPGRMPVSRGCACSRGDAYSGGFGPVGCLVENPLDGYCCRGYASYWNAFLFPLCLKPRAVRPSIIVHLPESPVLH